MRIILAVVALLVMVGCDVPASKPTTDQANRDVQAITFARHASGLCFALLRFPTYGGMEGTSIALVPSEYCK